MLDKSIVYLPSVDFNFLTQAPQQMLMAAAKRGWKVIYCNAHRRTDIYMEEVAPNLTVCHDFFRFKEECRRNNRKFGVRLVSIPQYVAQHQFPKGKINVFALYDHFDSWEKGEASAFAGSNIVFTTADYLYDIRKKYNHPYFSTIKNGVPEYYLNHKVLEPDEFKNLPRPIIGMIGSIGSWVDTSLIKKIADKYTTVFIGKELDKKLPSNVINLGYIDNAKLVDYYGSIDVGIIPFRTSGIFGEITRASCPIKLFEYMGVGTPCVANKWRETDIYPNIVFTGDNDDDFMDNIEKAISLNREEYRILAKNEAAKHTWESRWIELENQIKLYCKDKNIPNKI